MQLWAYRPDSAAITAAIVRWSRHAQHSPGATSRTAIVISGKSIVEAVPLTAHATDAKEPSRILYPTTDARPISGVGSQDGVARNQVYGITAKSALALREKVLRSRCDGDHFVQHSTDVRRVLSPTSCPVARAGAGRNDGRYSRTLAEIALQYEKLAESAEGFCDPE
jgi:hypothetical protein